MDTSKWKIIASRDPELMLIDMQEPNPEPGWEMDTMGRILDLKGKTVTVPISIGRTLKHEPYWDWEDPDQFPPMKDYLKGMAEVDMEGKRTGMKF